ncbi:MAG TPA: bifunctional (p)ppGpp synthetase/guanosine-3',5'-bis(diphosphate) 3'-pyrophosphohydrolase [Egicoccus sp.]|nr:bifunctional (p)ppGpp synthetase/guanosine-3',5'-bis(diphosphate) 3'-pyrophosphohydrolase [Egicoccus sp.]HSK24454.1 bifunctional (p)ppGpp synthetase/guanosine-3',5'-bis(diphosphate) 3'-pyrophosphohydrolase [Egicoccus sp.]
MWGEKLAQEPGTGTEQGRETRPAPRPARPSGVLGVFSRLPLVQREQVPPELEGLAAAIRASSRADVREVVRAYRFAELMHEGQKRKSGEAYITHPVAVATELATLGLGTPTLAAALLHDTVEDTPATLEDIREGFGEEVAHLVDGVTKLDRIHVESKQQQQAETLRKMILAMARDIRVLVIKLADRLHNMETIGHMPREKQKRIAQETLDIYAPLAHRLGMQNFKLRLEDLGFKTLHPKRYDEIVAMVDDRNPEREAYIEEVIASIRDQLRELKVRGEVTGRPKHYYSIYEKMVLRGKEFDEIYDLVAVRVIVSSVRDCYAVLGQLHAAWRPVPGRFKDYIAMPKVNLYQSLHTSVIGPKGRPLEIQIRTRAMHETAEYGVAAHWKYKDGARNGDGDAAGDDLPWIEQLLEWQQEIQEPGDYLESLKIELYQDEVFVFTPKGEVMGLPAGSTPIDFAYAVHTEVGHRCIGARVNGRLVPLDHPLVNGDTIEVLTSKAEDAGPSRDWLQIAGSTRAQSKIRAYFNRERREDAITRGRDAITRALRRKGISYARAMAAGDLTDVARSLSYKNVEALFRAVGESHVSAATVAQQVLNELTEVEEDAAEEIAPPTSAPIRLTRGSGDDVEVEGDSGMLVKLARCCTPVPGDEIIGFVTRGRGVSVHRADCSNVTDLKSEPERFVPVDWTGEVTTNFLVSVQIEALDRKHLLRDITAVLGDLHINITSAQVATRKDRVAVLRFQFELGDPTHLEYALRSVRSVDGVYDAYRVVPQTAAAR